MAAAATIAAVLCHSFEGLQQLYGLWMASAPLDLVRYTNIDGVTRWAMHGMPIDGLQRLLLYQPQHQLGYVLGWSALIVIMCVQDALRPRVAALIGTLLALSFLVSTFSALMLTVACSIALGLIVIPLTGLVRRRDLRDRGGSAARGRGGAGGAAAIHRAWRRAGHRRLESCRRQGLAGSDCAEFWRRLDLPRDRGGARLARARSRKFEVLAITIATCWFFYFMVDVRDHQDVYVGWRAGHLLFIAFAPVTAYAWDRLRQERNLLLRVGGLLVSVAVLAASAPTSLIDIYNTQDTENRMMARHHWTLQLTPGEVEALTWVRAWTPQKAIVQVDPWLRDRETWAYVPAFAERRMAAGLPISMIPLANYERASQAIKVLFSLSSADDAHELARKLRIDYLLIAQPERSTYPGFEATLDSAPKQFRRVFHNDDVSIYEVEKP